MCCDPVLELADPPLDRDSEDQSHHLDLDPVPADADPAEPRSRWASPSTTKVVVCVGDRASDSADPVPQGEGPYPPGVVVWGWSRG